VAARKDAARPKNFYSGALTEVEKAALEAAAEMEGLADEAAVLRVKLRSLLAEEKVDPRLLRYGIDALVKVVATQYRLSPKSKRQMAEAVAAAVENLGELMRPPGV
jgi:hypothetical protein